MRRVIGFAFNGWQDSKNLGSCQTLFDKNFQSGFLLLKPQGRVYLLHMAGPLKPQQLTASQQAQLFKTAVFPPYPDSLKKRFPEMAAHEEAVKEWLAKFVFNIQNLGQ